jgi:hypothetical protein
MVLISAAFAGDQGDPDRACDGNTLQMVECLKAKTAQWDKRMTIAYQQAMKDAMTSSVTNCARPSGSGFNIATPIACITTWARVPSSASTPANACAA